VLGLVDLSSGHHGRDDGFIGARNEYGCEGFCL
jgi:hypothetical protein